MSKLQRTLVVDGPPFVGVAAVFVVMLIVWLGRGQPAIGMAVLAVGLAATLTLDFREWRTATRADRRAAEGSWASLPARLKHARARRIELDRWR